MARCWSSGQNLTVWAILVRGPIEEYLGEIILNLGKAHQYTGLRLMKKSIKLSIQISIEIIRTRRKKTMYACTTAKNKDILISIMYPIFLFHKT